MSGMEAQTSWGYAPQSKAPAVLRQSTALGSTLRSNASSTTGHGDLGAHHPCPLPALWYQGLDWMLQCLLSPHILVEFRFYGNQGL